MALNGVKRKISKVDLDDIENDYVTRSEKRPKEHDEEKETRALKGIQSVLKISETFSMFFKKRLEKRHGLKGENGRTDQEVNSGDLLITKYFEGSLRDYQIEGVQWLKMLYENHMNGILGDEMGLGKTVQIIALICFFYEKGVKGPFLILAPLSTLPNWTDEFKRFAPKIPVVVLHGIKDARNQLKANAVANYTVDGKVVKPVVLSSYTDIAQEKFFFVSTNWTYLILDEGQRIKNCKSQIHLLLMKFKASNRLILTGTPIQNSLIELWSLLKFLMPNIFNKIDVLSSLLVVDDMQDQNLIIRKEEENNIITKIHKVLEPFMLRRLKADVLSENVPKKEVLVYCPVTSLQKKLYNFCLDKILQNLSKSEPEVFVDQPRQKRKCTLKSTSVAVPSTSKPVDEDEHYYKKIEVSTQNFVMTFKKIVNHPFLVDPPVLLGGKDYYKNLILESGKMLVLELMLKKLKVDGHKILLFSTFTSVLDLIEDVLIEKKYKYKRLDGNSSLEARKVDVAEFNQDSSIFVFLLSTRAGGLGLNLVSADTVIFYDRDWNPQADLQAQDRCHRIGQTRPVMVFSLVTKNTIDERIIKAGDHKRILEKLVIKGDKFKTMSGIGRGSTKLNIEDLKAAMDMGETTKFQFSPKQIDALLDRTELYKQMNIKQ